MLDIADELSEMNMISVISGCELQYSFASTIPVAREKLSPS